MRYAVRVLMEGEASREDKQMLAFVRSIDAGYLTLKISPSKDKARRKL
jgi:hypothetical protein